MFAVIAKMPLMEVLLFIHSKRNLVPPLTVCVTAPIYLVASSSWGVISSLLPRRWFALIDDKMYCLYQRFLLFFFENVSGVDLRLYGDTDVIMNGKQENVIYMSNHQSTVDWAVVNMLAARQGSLGSVRYLLKDGLQYVPLYGWYFYHRGSVYVRRKSFKQEIVDRELRYLCESSIPLWLVIFPEGTRYYQYKRKELESSRTFAKSSGLEPLSHFFTPKSRGFHLACTRLRDKLDAVYDVTIFYSSSRNACGERVDALDMLDFIASGPSRPTAHIHIKRYAIEDIPEAENDIRIWLHDRFCDKEKYFLKLFNTSDEPPVVFDGPVVCVERLPFATTVPPLLMFVCAGLCAIASPYFRSLYWKAAVFGTFAGYAWLKLRKAA